MTLKTRLTLFIVIWVTVILTVFNLVSVIWFRTHAMNSVRQTMQFELNEVAKLASAVPHLSLRDDNWERSALLMTSAIRFVDGSGTVTSQAVSPEFPTHILEAADQKWQHEVRKDIRLLQSQMGPGMVVQHQGPNFQAKATFTGDNSTIVDNPQYVHWLPMFVTGNDDRFNFISVEEPFWYPNGTPGRVQVVGTLASFAAENASFLQVLLGTDAVVVLMLAVGTYIVATRGLRPLTAMMDSIRQVEWSLSARVAVPGAPREIDSLTETINQLLDKVEQGVQEQKRFIADASHELRTPLAIVAGHANLLRRWGKTNEQVWEPAVHHIVAEVDRLQKLVNNLLLLSRLESGVGVETMPMDAEEIRTLVSQLRNDGEVLRPDLRWKVSFHLSKRLQTQTNQHDLRQMLVILLDNAMQHTPAGGNIELMVHADERQIRFTVRDSGDGIPKNAIPRVFDRFYRAEASRSRQYGGSGLGLSICRELVESYRGRIIIDSQLGEGTTVNITLPILEIPHMDSLAEDTLV